MPISDIDIVKPFRGISNIKSAGDTIKVSKEEKEFLVKEVQKCKQDIIYFAENYFYIVSYKGKHVIKLFDKQKLMLKSFIENNFTVVLSSRQMESVSNETMKLQYEIKHLEKLAQ